MQKAAVVKAATRLNQAGSAIQHFYAAGTRGDFGAFATAWTDFLVKLHGFYNVLEIGSRGHPKSAPWFGRIKHVRRTDALLCYLHHARNADEHGLEQVLDNVSQAFLAVPFGNAVLHSLTAQVGNITVEVPPTPEGYRSPIGMLIPVGVGLKPVTDRAGNIIQPPVTHLGQSIAGSSITQIATMAHTYCGGVFEEADGLSAGVG